VNRNDGRLPSQLRVVGATDLERRLLEASARERPSVELTERMQKALGISLAAGAAATAAGAAKAQAATAGAATPAVAWPAISIGVLALAVTGAVVGVRSTASHRAASQPAAALTAPPAAAPDISAPLAPPAPAATVERRVAAPAHHHAAPSATPADLRAEIALVDAARSAVAGGAGERALVLLGRYDRSYPRGTFRPEAAALRIEALARLGRTTQARALAQRFIAAHADSPLADRVARVTGLPAR
jgi:hypothetical protein